MLLGEGRGFEIAQGRLGPGRIHHCMRTIGKRRRGAGEDGEAAVSRAAFGKRIVEHSVWEQRIGEARTNIEMTRLLCLKAADMMDKVGNKTAQLEIAMIKVAAPNMALKIIDEAIQAFGGAGVSDESGLAKDYAGIRTLRLADGPDEVHNRAIARLELRKYSNAPGANEARAAPPSRLSGAMRSIEPGISDSGSRPSNHPGMTVNRMRERHLGRRREERRGIFRHQAGRGAASHRRGAPRHLDAHHVEGFSGPLTVLQFRGGQSNPTYRLDTPRRSYVMRRKPFGKLLPSAHAVDREYRVIDALSRQGFPVARAYALCTDDSVIGAAFYIMSMVDGRVFWDPTLPSQTPDDRRKIFTSKIETLAKLHTFDPNAIGLGDFGKPGNHFARQVDRWTKQYRASETQHIPEIEKLIDWLPQAPCRCRSASRSCMATIASTT